MISKISVICVLLYFAKVNEANQRIVGGIDAVPGSAPYAVSLQNLGGTHVCGGAIITNNCIISAAHCFVDTLPEYVIAIVGTTDLNEGGNKYNISKIILHKDYNKDTKEHDIAIILTSKKIRFSNRINRISFLPHYIRGGEELIFTGYGSLGNPDSFSTTLQTITLTVLNMTTCKYAYRNIRPLFDSQMCTFNAIGQGTCHGDSGAPLVFGSSLVGIASFGVPCAVGYPDVFTRTSTYIPWIKTYAPDM